MSGVVFLIDVGDRSALERRMIWIVWLMTRRLYETKRFDVCKCFGRDLKPDVATKQLSAI